jgi:hypothetical protein
MKIRLNIDIVKIIKKNTAIIIPAVIAVAAILLFVPTYLMRGQIKIKLEDSVKVGKEVESSLRTKLSGNQYEVAKKFEDMHQADANEIENLARQTSQRELISYKVLPEPNESSAQIFNEFKKAYSRSFAGLTNDMNALDAPTDNEIHKQAGSVDLATAAETSAATDSRSGKSSDIIVELICRRRSEEVPVYANPKAFSGYAAWDKWEYSGAETAVRKCWYSQLAYWIHKDIVDTINYMNQGSTSIAKSSVKRLLGVNFTNINADSGGDNSLELPVYLTNTGGGLCAPWTGRKCDDQIDVVHFSLTVVVRADDVLKFMDALCSEKQHYFAGYKGDQKPEKYAHNQITILLSSIEPIDRNSQEHKRYFYGDNAIVLLNLACEYVFNRQGYDPVKPHFVQVTDINGVATGTQQAAPSAPTERRAGTRGSRAKSGGKRPSGGGSEE